MDGWMDVLDDGWRRGGIDGIGAFEWCNKKVEEGSKRRPIVVGGGRRVARNWRRDGGNPNDSFAFNWLSCHLWLLRTCTACPPPPSQP
jgi:hypothetical protein